MAIVHANDRVGAWRAARRRVGRMLVALDYDGTLAPIVDRPERAALPEPTRATVARLAARPDTDVAIVSGRALEDVRSRVGVAAIYYAGNHGLEIEGPGIVRVHPGAAAARPRVEACAAALREALGGIAGAEIEDKGITLSVHYRRVAAAEVERVRERTFRVCEGRAGLRVTEGKRVIEVRPDVDWDKGRATRFLLDALELDALHAAPAVFIGDDRTDEDAFRALEGRGEGVLVVDAPPPDTAAAAYVRSTEEVATLLAALAAPDPDGGPRGSA